MKRAFFYWAPAIVFACLVLVLSLMPNSGGPDYGWDKMNHLMAYAVLSFLFTRAMSAGTTVSLKTAAAAVAVVFLFGIVVEFLQSMTETRRAEGLDAVANGLGATLGAIVLSLIKNRTEVKRCS